MKPLTIIAYWISILVASVAAATERPNIVLIYADDQGWKDMGYQSEGAFKTPVLDRLAKEGLVFTDAYTNAANCQPARACLLSGNYTPRHHVFAVNTTNRGPKNQMRLIPTPNRDGLAEADVTMADALKAAGYATGHFGKWHLYSKNGKGGGGALPSKQGFDVTYDSFGDGELPEGAKGNFKGPSTDPKGVFDLSNQACAFMEANQDKPFFVYLAHHAPHAPVNSRESTRKMIKAGYQACIYDLDASVDLVLKKIKQLGIEKDTLIIYTSDNGGSNSQKPLRGTKGMYYEGGIREPMIAYWPGVIEPGSTCSTPVMQIDYLPTFLELAGATTEKTLDGESLLPLLKQSGDLKRSSLFWHMPGYLDRPQEGARDKFFRTRPVSVIRKGDWKLHFYHEEWLLNGGIENVEANNSVELYNLKNDIGEKDNLAQQNPEIRDALVDELVSWQRSVNAPMPKEKKTTTPVPAGKQKVEAEQVSNSPRPNILLIMADDMGYSDLGCYGSTIPTPHIDSLAKNGIKYNQFYNAARCCPTRAALLTGLYPHQTGVGWMTAADLGSKGYTGDLNDECRTIAECLKDAGYSTYLSGKWHVTYGKNVGSKGPMDSWPIQRGFDRFYGMLSGGASYWKPKLNLDNQAIEPGEDYYLTEGITRYANLFLNEHFESSADKPFFLYLAHYAPHLPLHARPEDIAKYRGKFKKGWDVLREEKYQRMVEMGIIDPSTTKLPKRERKARAWDSLSAEEQEAMELRMAIYAAQIDSLDRGIGEVLETLKQNKAFENTLILFLSDNGADATFSGRNNKDLATFGSDASKLGYGPSWANYSNVPFRQYKMWAHEGGISSPLIAHWPKGIKPQQEINTQLGHVTDLLPTFLELAGASYQPKGGEKTYPDLAGQSLVPTFSGSSYERDPILWEHKGNRALRKGKWKLVADGIKGNWELYDIEADRSELNNLAKQHPEIVTAMASHWDKVAKATHVYPLDGRSWGEKIKNPIPSPGDL